MGETPTMAEVIRSAIESNRSDIHTAIPACVMSYDAATQTADIKPEIKRVIRTRLGEPVEEALPVIPAVPVVFPGSGEFFMSFPVQPGDTGMLIFCERNIDRWRETEGDVNPGDQRAHGLAGATFHPGLRRTANALADANGSNMAFGRDGGFVVHVTTMDDIELPAGSTEFLARADRVEDEIQVIVDAITNAIPVPNDGGAALKADILMALNNPVGNTASDKVKGT